MGFPPVCRLPAGIPQPSPESPRQGAAANTQLEVTDTLAKQVSIYGNLTLNVYEAPTITSPNKATFPTGLPGLVYSHHDRLSERFGPACYAALDAPDQPQ